MTFQHIVTVLILLAALGSGLIAGIFFAFSAFVMQALSRLPAHEGIAAMQFINIAIINPYFMAVFLGTPALCLLAIVSTLFRWSQPSAVYLLVGAVIYVVGCFMVTMLFNVPLNNALASVTPTDAGGAKLWASYVSTWTMWNSVRTAASFVSMVLFIIALRFE